MQDSLQIVVMFLLGLPTYQDVVNVGHCSGAVLQRLMDGLLENGTRILEAQWHLNVLVRPKWCHREHQRLTLWMQGNIVVGLAEVQCGKKG